TLAVEDMCHVRAERLHEHDYDGAVQEDLDPADNCHGFTTSEALGTQQRIGEIDQETEAHQGSERIVKTHGPYSSQPFAGVAVADRQHEEAEPNGQQDDVHHGMLLSARNLRATTETPVANETFATQVSERLCPGRPTICHSPHRISRRAPA